MFLKKVGREGTKGASLIIRIPKPISEVINLKAGDKVRIEMVKVEQQSSTTDIEHEENRKRMEEMGLPTTRKLTES